MNALSRIKALDLPVGQYVVFGSAVMEVHGIRPARDIDLVITEELYQALKRRGWKRKWNFKRVFICKALKFKNEWGNNEAFTNLDWKNYRIQTADLIKNAQFIEGIPFMSLKDYLFYKKHLPRKKDKEDVELIENDIITSMEQKLDTKEEFSLVKRAKSFSHAGRGLKVFLKTTHNAWIHTLVCLVAVVLGVYFGISRVEWLILILVSGLVFTAEAFNTAIEIDIDLTSPTYHPYARDTKDVAAGAVLISAITALIVGLIIFVPYLYLFIGEAVVVK